MGYKFKVIYPNTLKLDISKVYRIVEEIVSEKMRPTLVQAIAFYRQRKKYEAMKAIHNLASQYRAIPQKISWEQKGEIKELYTMYHNISKSKELNSDVAEVLGITSDDILELEKTRDSKENKNEEISDMMDELSYFGP